MKPGSNLSLGGEVLTPWKAAAVFLPFALAVFYALHNHLSGLAFAIPWIALLAALLAISIAGLAGGFPGWALPSLGVLLSIFYFYFFKLGATMGVYTLLIYPLWRGWPQGLFPGILMLMVVGFATALVMAVVMLVLLLLLPGFHRRVSADWTLLSLLLYGMALLPLFMDDVFHHLELYQAAAVLVMALGAAAYLKAPTIWLRVLSLALPVLLSQVIFSLGLYLTYPLEAWISLSDPNQRIWEAIQPLSDPLVVILFLPALHRWIPRRWIFTPSSVGL